MAGGWHQFRAPIDGKACRFVVRCSNGKPDGLFCIHPGHLSNTRLYQLVQDLRALTKLLKGGLPWDVVRLQHQGNLGAVIEAAETRRAEIYDREVAA